MGRVAGDGRSGILLVIMLCACQPNKSCCNGSAPLTAFEFHRVPAPGQDDVVVARTVKTQAVNGTTAVAPGVVNHTHTGGATGNKRDKEDAHDNVCAYLMRAKRLSFDPRAVNLIWFDGQELNNPAYALYVAALAADDPRAAIQQLCAQGPPQPQPYNLRYVGTRAGFFQGFP